MNELTFTIMGKPQGKARPRFTRSGHAYTPNRTAYYESTIRRAYREAHGTKKLKGRVIAFVKAYFKPPASESKKHKELMLAGKIPYTKKPDCDSIAKCVLDALNGVAYDDDAAVNILISTKMYGEEDKVEIILKGELET